jgi:hypothetical protein
LYPVTEKKKEKKKKKEEEGGTKWDWNYKPQGGLRMESK